MPVRNYESKVTLNYPSASIVEEAVARRAVNSYLSRSVGIPFGAVSGIFIPLSVPIWQFVIEFRLPRLGELGIMGTIDANAETGEPLLLAPSEIQKIQDRANSYSGHKIGTNAIAIP